MKNQPVGSNQCVDPCRIIVIGLPFSGKKEVAKILNQQHGCTLLEYDQTQKEQQSHKAVANLCFDDYRGKAVLVMEKCNLKILQHLKKRNFVNVLFVEATFKKRFENYCLANGLNPNSLENYQNFAIIDENFQTNNDYQECLEFTRVRIFNAGTFQELKTAISKDISSIVRPFRPGYDEYFMKIADIARRRSNCMKSSVGAVIVNDNNRVVSTGYNGTPRGIQSCFNDGCHRCNSNSNKGLDECLCLHGEESAILQVGILKTAGCKLYTTMYPCFSCAKIIKQAGIKKIYYMDPYNKEDNGEKFLKENYSEKDIVQVLIENVYY